MRCTKKLRFKCQHCDKTYTDKQNLKRHDNSLHVDVKNQSYLKLWAKAYSPLQLCYVMLYAL